MSLAANGFFFVLVKYVHENEKAIHIIQAR
jgi:hypothetical protein